MKSFELEVANVVSGAPWPLLVAKVPWAHFRAPAIRNAYAAAISTKQRIPVIVSMSPELKWDSDTTVKQIWLSVMAGRDVDDLPWEKETFESQWLPWEQPWSPDVGPD